MKRILISVVIGLLVAVGLSYAQYATTPHLGLKKPIVGGPSYPINDPNNYGNLMNSDLDLLDALTTGGLFSTPSIYNPSFSGTSTGSLTGINFTLPSPSLTGTVIGGATYGSGASPLTDIITKGPWVDVRAYGAKGDGVTDDGAAITSAIAAVPSGGTLFFPPLTFAYATSPNFAVANIKILGNGATLKHTGSGNAFILDSGTSGPAAPGMNILLRDINVQGNSNSTNCFYFRSIHHSRFENLRCLGSATTGAAFRLDFGVVNTWINPRATVNETGSISPIPLYGILLTRRGVGEDSTDQTIISPMIEGLTTATASGIYIDYASQTQVYGGTSEGNVNGVTITANGYGNNSIYGLDLEGNTTSDITITGSVYNSFYNIYHLGTVLVNGGYNNFISCNLRTVTIGAFGYNSFTNGIILTAFTDNGIGTMWMNVMGPGGIPIQNTINAQLKSTLATGTAPISVVSTTPNTNLNAYAVTYNNAGSQRTNQWFNWGTTSLVNGSQTVTFTSSSVYTSSVSFVTTANTKTTANAIGITQNSGSSVTFVGTGTNSFNWHSIGN